MVVDGLLVFFAWRKPLGFAGWFIVVRFASDAGLDFWFGHTPRVLLLGVFDVVAAAALTALIVVVRRRDRSWFNAEMHDLALSIEAESEWEVRDAAKRFERRRRRGCL